MNQKTKKSPRIARGPGFCEAAGLALTELLRGLAPPEAARQHFEAARLEVLKGMRALLDARIERCAKASRKGEKISVE